MKLNTSKKILGIWTRNKVQIVVNQGRLSIQHCAWTTSNTKKRMNTGQRYFKNNTRKKEYWPLHFIQENPYEKIPLAQMNQLKTTPHPGHDGISLSSMTMPHSEQIFFMKRTNDINIKVSPVIIDTKKLIGIKRLMASMIRPKTNKMIPTLHFFKPEFIWGISE